MRYAEQGAKTGDLLVAIGRALAALAGHHSTELERETVVRNILQRALTDHEGPSPEPKEPP
jgi:hypothetical protein